MHIRKLFLLASLVISTTAISQENGAKEKAIFSELSNCLKNIPVTEMKTEKLKTTKNLSLLNSVLLHMNHKLGTMPEVNEEYIALYKIANEYCATQIEQVLALGGKKG
jgi:hypothetical protein|tara:strand:+ start:105 stop:428 length:324 start_codon:yes stop_codon:yes gene_type:complete